MIVASTRPSRAGRGRRVHSAEVEEELRRARDELRRARQLVNLAETLDLDEVLTRVLQSAAVLADADAAAVVLFEEGDAPGRQGDEPLGGGGVAAARRLASREQAAGDDGSLPPPG